MNKKSDGSLALAGRVAIVTGAGSGIGKAAAERLAAAGVCVSAIDVKAVPLAKVCSSIRAAGGKTIALTADIRRELDVEDAVEKTIESFGKIDILVNAAAAFVREGVDAGPGHWREVLDVNVIGTALLCRYVSVEMRRRDSGSIINVGSVSGLLGQANYATYNASKAAVWSLTQCLAVDLGGHGIRVNCVSPGATDTPALRKAVQDAHMSQSDFKRKLFDQQCIRKLSSPQEIAGVILFLASDLSAAMTGCNVIVDRGMLIKR